MVCTELTASSGAARPAVGFSFRNVDQRVEVHVRRIDRPTCFCKPSTGDIGDVTSHWSTRDVDVAISELRANLKSYVDRARDGEHVVVTDRGVPVALLVPADHEELLEIIEPAPGSRRRSAGRRDCGAVFGAVLNSRSPIRPSR